MVKHKYPNEPLKEPVREYRNVVAEVVKKHFAPKEKSCWIALREKLQKYIGVGLHNLLQKKCYF